MWLSFSALSRTKSHKAEQSQWNSFDVHSRDSFHTIKSLFTKSAVQRVFIMFEEQNSTDRSICGSQGSTNIPSREQNGNDQDRLSINSTTSSETQTTKEDPFRTIIEHLKGIRQKMSVDLSEQSLNSLTLVAGFLVIAAFPLLTQDLSSTADYHPTHISSKAVRCFAAISVGLFLTVIISSQVTRLLFLRWAGPDPDCEDYAAELARLAKVEKEFYPKRVVLMVVLLETLAAAIAFFLLIVTAYEFVPGLVFLALDGTFAVVCLVLVPKMVWDRLKISARDTRVRFLKDIESRLPRS